VGAVVLDHAHMPGLSGGFVGVDVFFVISGFLITGLLLGDIAKHSRVRFMNFYSRRAQRILPAAAVTIVVTALASLLLLGALQARSVMVDSVWSAFFGANIHFAAIGTNYFSASSATSPLQHFWSLSVEEQFYLVWPALLGIVAVLFVKKGNSGHLPRIPIATVLVAITAISLYLSVTQTAANPTSAYFSTIDRTWELSAGALLAVGLPYVHKVPPALRSSLSWLGLLAIVYAVTTFTSLTPIPGSWALVPVLGCVALLAGGVGTPRGGAHALLSLRPFRFIGDISYSLYLWHWPLLIIGAAYLGARDTVVVRCTLIVAALVIATISYYGLENPLRHIKLFSYRVWRGLLLWPVSIGLVVSTAILATPSIPYAGASSATVTSLSPLRAIAQAVNAAQANTPVPHATDPSLLSAGGDHVNLGTCSQYPKFTGRLCQLGDPTGTKAVVLFGNSHSVMWEPALAIIAKQDHWKLYVVVREACGYDGYTGLSGTVPNACTTFYAWAQRIIPTLHPTVIVMGSYTATKLWKQGEADVLARLRPYTKRLILLSDVPWTSSSPATCLTSAGATQGTCMTKEPASRIADHSAPSLIAKNAHVQYLDVANLLCDQWLCPAVINGLIPTYDGIHLTPQYSAYVAPALAIGLNLTGTSTKRITSVPTV
jgi:peptidoglycan/LPS O-acetylase OafA/YrhL